VGFVHVYTGNGKGKTTCAVGLTVRACGAGKRVAFVQFDKGFEGRNEHYHERSVLRQLPGVDLFFYGMERIMPDGSFRFGNGPEDPEQARLALEKAKELVRSRAYFMVVCDEAVTCVATQLYGEDDLLDLVRVARENPDGELVLTGRGGFPRLVDAVDLVSEIQLVKHYFYGGAKARAGIEY
jgi:cob(I)alamin adenosyltransferase